MSSAMSEVAATVLSIDGPWLDLSDKKNLYKQDRLLHEIKGNRTEDKPIIYLYIAEQNSERVATGHSESTIYFDITINYTIDLAQESKDEGTERGRQCLTQLYDRIASRQTSGEALVHLYPSGGIDIKVTEDSTIDCTEECKLNGTASGKFTLKQIHNSQGEKNNA
jgi:hypothetical protein